MEINKDLMAASSAPLVLAILAEGESYGYAILQRVRKLSGGRMVWTDGMLYPVLHRLERLSLVEARWEVAQSGRRRKYYRIVSRPGGRKLLRISVLLVWALLLAAFWLGARRADMGPLEYLLSAIDKLSRRPWAPAGLLALYLLRPLLLVLVTLLNLASGFFLGPLWGVLFRMTGVLLSSTGGYGIGRFFGSAKLATTLSARWPLMRTLRSRTFETVLAGGLMYLHADAVNLPSGLLRIRFPVFLAGIAFGNALTLVTAVLTGASVEGRLADATITVKPMYLAIAAALLLVSLVLAYLVRKRIRSRGDGEEFVVYKRLLGKS
jgi:uncharacterized membrane protein YdjX (TVP38/TMEM64 family)